VPEAAADISADASLVAAPLPFACSWHANDLGAGWVQAAGELDLATAPQLRQTLTEAQQSLPLVVLDLRELTFMDGSGVHAIVEAAGEAKRAGGWLLVVHGSTQIKRLLTLTEASTQVLIIDLNASPPGPVLRLAPPCTEA
jgi:anti-sigma B factor antagonist